MLVSIIIPTLNEETNIPLVLQSLLSFSEIEVIVADGGSSDRTCETIQPFLLTYPFIHLVRTVRGRAVQMNAGAKIAKGEWLVFLHADTIIPESSWTHFREKILKVVSIRSGSFLFQADSERFCYRMMEALVNMRTRLARLPYGDQTLFIRKDQFTSMHGFREDYPLMEDVEFVKRLGKEKGFEILQAPVITSPRRHEKDGFFRRIAFNLLITTLYRAGVHPKKLVRFY